MGGSDIGGNRRLDPNDLILFALVATHGSFKKAAEHSGVPHSTISRRLMHLEEILGERLLHRTTRKLTLTDFGRMALSHAQQIKAELEATAELSQGDSEELKGHLRLSIPTDFTGDMLGSMLTRFTASYPKVTVDVDVSRRRVDLIAENFDLAIRIGDLPDDASLAASKVGTIKMGLYASPGYLAAQGSPAHPADLEDHSVLHLSQHLGDPMLLQLTTGSEVWHGVPTKRITANSPGVLMHMAVNDAGIASLANQLAERAVKEGALVPILPLWRQRENPIWAVMPGRRLISLRVLAFIDALRRELG